MSFFFNFSLFCGISFSVLVLYYHKPGQKSTWNFAQIGTLKFVRFFAIFPLDFSRRLCYNFSGRLRELRQCPGKKKEREFQLSLFHRPDEFPSAEAGHPVKIHLVDLTARNGLPKIVFFHFFIPFSFFLCGSGPHTTIVAICPAWRGSVFGPPP